MSFHSRDNAWMPVAWLVNSALYYLIGRIAQFWGGNQTSHSYNASTEMTSSPNATSATTPTEMNG